MERIAIIDSDNLLRRVQYLNPNFIKPDGTPASSSFTLKKSESGLSVDVERLSSHEKSIYDIKRFRLFSLHVEFVRSLNLQCEHDPQPDNIAHSLIKGSISKGIARQLAVNAVKINYPE